MVEAKPRRRRWLIPVVLVSIAVVADISLATYVFFFYGGSTKPLAPGEAHLLTDHVSNFFCQAEQVQLFSSDSSIHFDASVISGSKLNNRVPKTDQVSASPVIKAKRYVLWPFYLPSGARIYSQECTAGAKNNKVLSIIIEGTDVNEDCIKDVWLKSLSKDEDDNHDLEDLFSSKSCAGMLTKPMEVESCSGPKHQIQAKVDEPGYYSVLYLNTSPEQVQIVANISTSRLTYDLSSSLANCTSAKSCILPLRILSSDTIVAQVALTTKETTVAVKWSCVRQNAIFATLFGAVPLLLIITVVIIARRRRKNSRKRTREPAVSPTVSVTIQPDNERTPLLHNDDHIPGEMPPYGATPEVLDPVLSKVGPIPGPYLYRPTAPPNLSPEIPNTENGPIHQPTDQPPSYEETMKTRPEQNVT